MRITIMLPTYCRKPGGGYRVVYEYANQLVDLGHIVSVIHLRKLPNVDSIDSNLHALCRRTYHNIRDLISTPQKHWMDIDSHVKMLYMKKYNPDKIPDGDAVFATYWATAELVSELKKSKGAKFYLIQSYEDWAGPKDRVNATWKLKFKKVFIAKWLVQKARELHISENEIEYIPNAINHNIFKNKVPIGSRCYDIIMMYSPVLVKGANDGLRAINIVKCEMRNIKVAIFGLGNRPNIPTWMEYIKNPHKDFLVNNIYNQGKIFLCPSILEGWGLPPAEAMACGCAVASTANEGVKEYCIHGENSLLSPVRDPELLAKNILLLLKNDQFRQKIAENGMITIKKFSWEISSKLLEEFILKNINDVNISP